MNAQSNQESTRGLAVHHHHTFDISEEDSSDDSSESASTKIECDLGLMANNNKEMNKEVIEQLELVKQ